MTGREPDRSIAARVQALEDLEDIRDLMFSYHRVCDGWDAAGTHQDPLAVAELFTEDGVWDETLRQPPPTGRAEIAAFAAELQSIPWVVHFGLNPEVRVDRNGDVATGEFKGLLGVKLKPASSLVWVIGWYRIIAVRRDAAWRFQSMTWSPITHGRYDPDR